MKTRHLIVLGDARDMREVEDESVHLVITSPPYWQIKDYGTRAQIGFHDSYEEYINNLNLVWNETCRALYPGCRLCINIGDQFARSVYYGRYKVIPIRTEIIRFCETIGFDYLGAIIWQKVTTCRTSGGASIMGSYPYPRNGIVKLDYEFILIFKKPGEAPQPDRDTKEASRLSKDEWNQFFAGHWSFPGEKQDVHFAIFPEELPRRLIKMFTFRGETVLDPFLGSGTTTLAAKNLGRNSIGYEINHSVLATMKEKLGIESLLGNADAEFTIKQQHGVAVAWDKMIDHLPYRFRDAVRITRTSSETALPRPAPDRLLTVKHVLDPDRLILSDGRAVRLIGIRERAGLRERAVAFLHELTHGQKVYLLSEDGSPCTGTHGSCYLYLRNRTFVNARLVKSGLVAVDETSDYRHRERFTKYLRQVRPEEVPQEPEE